MKSLKSRKYVNKGKNTSSVRPESIDKEKVGSTHSKNTKQAKSHDNIPSKLLNISQTGRHVFYMERFIRRLHIEG